MNSKIRTIALFLIFSWLLFPFSGKTQQTIGLFLNDSLSLNGYTLFTVSTETYLIDNCGHLVKTWTSNHQPGLSVYLLENGDLLRPGRGGSGLIGNGMGGVIERFSWEGDLLWSYAYANDTVRQHHDIEIMPNGNVLLLAWEAKSQEEAIANGRNPATTGSQIFPEHIVEVKPIGSNQGEIVWEWHAWDHMIQDFDDEKANFGIIAEHPELFDVNYLFNNNPNTNMDWMHANAIAYHPERDEIAISSRHFGEIWIIDHSTSTAEAASHEGGQSNKGGDLLYRWGNPQTYGRGTPMDQRFFGQHNVQWIPKGYPNEDKIIVFNNGFNRPDGLYSTVDVIAPPLNNDGSYQLSDNAAYGPSDLYWTYREGEAYSSAMSGAQPLSNGNVLICYANGMRFKEVTQDGKLVWEYISSASNTGPLPQETPNSGSTFRATRYAVDYPAFKNRDLSPQGPIELDPIPYDCSIFDGTVANRKIPLPQLEIRQNPVAEYLHITKENGRRLVIRIFNVTGQLLLEKESAEEQLAIPVEHLISGLYFVQISEPHLNGSTLVKKIVKK